MIKYCAQCNKALGPKRSNEAYEQYAKRRFCRSKCAAIWQRTAARQKWNEKHKTPVVRETIRAATEAEFLRLNGWPDDLSTALPGAHKRRHHAPLRRQTIANLLIVESIFVRGVERSWRRHHPVSEEKEGICRKAVGRGRDRSRGMAA